MMTEEGSEGCDIIGFECGGRGQEPRNAGSLQKLEKARRHSRPEPPERNTALLAPGLQPCETVADF